jgi:hypothetical protein
MVEKEFQPEVLHLEILIFGKEVLLSSPRSNEQIMFVTWARLHLIGLSFEGVKSNIESTS